MFLRATLRRNPKLIEVAFRFHQAGVIPPNTYVIDLDAVSANAGVIKKASNEAGLSLYAMTKQFGRNPLVMGEIARRGIPKAVAVDTEEAKVLARHRIEIGHVGHLVQVPTIEVRRVLEMRPEVLTVFSVAKARQVSIACQELGLHQDLLLRVRSVGDFFYPAQEGGVDESGLLDAAVEIQRLPGVRLVGVTSHPCLLYDYQKNRVRPTPNLPTIVRAGKTLQDKLGLAILQINAPGLSTASTFAMLAEAGATHAEPGSSFTGHTPLHAYRDEPELPAMVYVTEVSHLLEERVFVFGGGFYRRGRVKEALVGSTFDDLMKTVLPARPVVPENIDYTGELQLLPGTSVAVGDTVIYAFRAQAFVGNATVAVVAGVQKGTPALMGLFNHLGNPLDSEGYPFGKEAIPGLLGKWESERCGGNGQARSASDY